MMIRGMTASQRVYSRAGRSQPLCPVCLAQPRPHGIKSQAGKLHLTQAASMDHGLGPSSLQLPRVSDALPEPTRSWTGLTKEEVTAYLSMARLHNTLPALLLVLVGAWAGAGRNPAVLTNWTVWLMAFISAGVSAASMVINDYFDYVSGNDQLNAPEKPLPSGLAKPDVAVLLSGGLYVAVLMGACVMESPVVRAIIAFSAGATLLYTPVFKRVTMVKNALVASVVALAPLSGALAAGASLDILQRLACPSLFAFTGIMYREVLMDCTDEPGDRASGVTTLPVLLGAPAALLISTTFLLAGAGAAIAAMLTSSIPAAAAAAAAATITPAAAAGAAVATHSLPTTLAWPHLACVGLVGLTVTQLVFLVVNVFRCNFSQESLSKAVDNCIKPLGLAIIMLAATA